MGVAGQIDTQKGTFTCAACLGEFDLLPLDQAPQSAPYEFIHTSCPAKGGDPRVSKLDTNVHYRIDEGQVAEFYKNRRNALKEALGLKDVKDDDERVKNNPQLKALEYPAANPHDQASQQGVNSLDDLRKKDRGEQPAIAGWSEQGTLERGGLDPGREGVQQRQGQQFGIPPAGLGTTGGAAFGGQQTSAGRPGTFGAASPTQPGGAPAPVGAGGPPIAGQGGQPAAGPATPTAPGAGQGPALPIGGQGGAPAAGPPTPTPGAPGQGIRAGQAAPASAQSAVRYGRRATDATEQSQQPQAAEAEGQLQDTPTPGAGRISPERGAETAQDQSFHTGEADTREGQ